MHMGRCCQTLNAGFQCCCLPCWFNQNSYFQTPVNFLGHLHGSLTDPLWGPPKQPPVSVISLLSPATASPSSSSWSSPPLPLRDLLRVPGSALLQSLWSSSFCVCLLCCWAETSSHFCHRTKGPQRLEFLQEYANYFLKVSYKKKGGGVFICQQSRSLLFFFLFILLFAFFCLWKSFSVSIK